MHGYHGAFPSTRCVVYLAIALVIDCKAAKFPHLQMTETRSLGIAVIVTLIRSLQSRSTIILGPLHHIQHCPRNLPDLFSLSPSNPNMTRTINLSITSNGARPAHWAIFVPSADSSTMGKFIHVTGNPATGFFLEFKRNYDIKNTDREHHIIPLAEVEERFITAMVADAKEERDTIARDRLESVANIVKPPPRSPNPFDPSVSKLPLRNNQL